MDRKRKRVSRMRMRMKFRMKLERKAVIENRNKYESKVSKSIENIF